MKRLGYKEVMSLIGKEDPVLLRFHILSKNNKVSKVLYGRLVRVARRYNGISSRIEVRLSDSKDSMGKFRYINLDSNGVFREYSSDGKRKNSFIEGFITVSGAV